MAKKIGNYNENLASVYKIISDDPLILKLLAYNNDTDVLDEKELSSAEKSKIRKEHIFNVKQVERYSVDNGVYISIEYDIVGRPNPFDTRVESNRLLNKNYINIFITCSQMLLDGANGNRVLSLEWAIEQALTNAKITATHNCRIGNSLPDRTVDGYYGRLLPIEFLDRNDGEYHNA